MKTKQIQLLATTVLSLVTFSTAQASFVTNVTINAASSQFNAGRSANYLVAEVGLYGDAHVQQPIGAMWLSAAGNVSTNFVTFDLGAIRPVAALKVWNYNEENSGVNVLRRRGVAAADILTSTDGINFTTNLANVAFAAAPGLQTSFGQTISLGGISARYVRINVITNQFTLGADNLVGLSKVRFIDTNVPPALVAATRNYSSNQVTVFFSETVTPVTATNLAHYAIQTSGTNSAAIVSVTIPDGYANRVVFQTTPLTNATYTLVASSVAAASDGRAIPNTTVPVEPELSFWFAADAGVTTSLSGHVSAWADRSPAGNHAAQIDPNYQPVWVDGEINGKPVLRFTGTAGFTNFLSVPTSPTLKVRGGDFAFFTVMKVPVLGINNTLPYSRTTNNNPAPFDSRIRNDNNRLHVFRGNGQGNNNVQSTTSVTANTPFLASLVSRGTNLSVYFNGAFNAATFAGAGLDDFDSQVNIGARFPDLGTKLNGDVAEVLFIRGAITDSERIAISEELGAKYGLTIVSLVFNQQPASAVKLQGETATFVVNVTANSPNISYQWQRFGTNLPNATNFFYTTPTLTLADDNSSYRVQVTVNASSQFSDTATLTVLPDNVLPSVVSAGRKIWQPDSLVVVYSEPMDPATATNASNYTLNNGATVTAAGFGESTKQVVLATTGLTNGGNYSLTIQNTKDLFNNTVTPVQIPLGIYPVPALWLRADAGITLGDSNRVSAWNDQSGNGNHAAPLFNFADFAPYYQSNSFNGHPAVRFGFDGVDFTTNVMTCANSPSLTLDGDFTILAVASFIDYNGFRGIAGKTAINIPAPFDFYLNNGNGLPRLQRGNGNTFSLLQGVKAPPTNTPALIQMTVAGGTLSTNMAAFLNGLTNGVANQTSPVQDNGGELWIGHRWTDQATTLRGDVAELLVFGSALSATDTANLNFYLAGKYELPAGSPPTLSITGSGGSSVILTWPVSILNFALESAPNVSAGPWVTVTNPVTTTSGTNSINVSGQQPAEFFRLRAP